MMIFSGMKKLWSILLLGALSMLFAEVFSGASTLWFLDAWGLLAHLSIVSGSCDILVERCFSLEKNITSSAVLLRDALWVV